MTEDEPTTHVLWLGFNFNEIQTYLNTIPSKIDKVVIFDSDNNVRESYETLYKIYKDKITLYEGNIATNIEAYLKQHKNVDYIWQGNFELLNKTKHKMTEDEPTTHVLWLEFNFNEIQTYLNTIPSKIDKVVIFDSDDNVRESYETLYKIYKDKITLYEGNIATNIEAYLKQRFDKNVDYIWKGNFELLSNTAD